MEEKGACERQRSGNRKRVGSVAFASRSPRPGPGPTEEDGAGQSQSLQAPFEREAHVGAIHRPCALGQGGRGEGVCCCTLHIT